VEAVWADRRIPRERLSRCTVEKGRPVVRTRGAAPRQLAGDVLPRYGRGRRPVIWPPIRHSARVLGGTRSRKLACMRTRDELTLAWTTGHQNRKLATAGAQDCVGRRTRADVTNDNVDDGVRLWTGW